MIGQCDNCGTTIVFNGIKDSSLLFCNDKCKSKSLLLIYAKNIQQKAIDQKAQEIKNCACPKCGDAGQVGLHTSYKVWSMIFITSWRSEPQICCKSCGVKSQIFHIIKSLLFGWWGLPWGIIITPVQVLRNVIGLFQNDNYLHPSDKLKDYIRLVLAHQRLGQAGR